MWVDGPISLRVHIYILHHGFVSHLGPASVAMMKKHQGYKDGVYANELGIGQDNNLK